MPPLSRTTRDRVMSSTYCAFHDARPSLYCTEDEPVCKRRIEAYRALHPHGGARGSVPGVVPVPLDAADLAAYRKAPAGIKREARTEAAIAIRRVLARV